MSLSQQPPHTPSSHHIAQYSYSQSMGHQQQQQQLTHTLPNSVPNSPTVFYNPVSVAAATSPHQQRTTSTMFNQFVEQQPERHQPSSSHHSRSYSQPYVPMQSTSHSAIWTPAQPSTSMSFSALGAPQTATPVSVGLGMLDFSNYVSDTAGDDGTGEEGVNYEDVLNLSAEEPGQEEELEGAVMLPFGSIPRTKRSRASAAHASWDGSYLPPSSSLPTGSPYQHQQQQHQQYAPQQLQSRVTQSPYSYQHTYNPSPLIGNHHPAGVAHGIDPNAPMLAMPPTSPVASRLPTNNIYQVRSPAAAFSPAASSVAAATPNLLFSPSQGSPSGGAFSPPAQHVHFYQPGPSGLSQKPQQFQDTPDLYQLELDDTPLLDVDDEDSPSLSNPSRSVPGTPNTTNKTFGMMQPGPDEESFGLQQIGIDEILKSISDGGSVGPGGDEEEDADEGEGDVTIREDDGVGYDVIAARHQGLVGLGMRRDGSSQSAGGEPPRGGYVYHHQMPQPYPEEASYYSQDEYEVGTVYQSTNQGYQQYHHPPPPPQHLAYQQHPLHPQYSAPMTSYPPAPAYATGNPSFFHPPPQPLVASSSAQGAPAGPPSPLLPADPRFNTFASPRVRRKQQQAEEKARAVAAANWDSAFSGNEEPSSGKVPRKKRAQHPPVGKRLKPGPKPKNKSNSQGDTSDSGVHSPFSTDSAFSPNPEHSQPVPGSSRVPQLITPLIGSEPNSESDSGVLVSIDDEHLSPSLSGAESSNSPSSSNGLGSITTNLPTELIQSLYTTVLVRGEKTASSGGDRANNAQKRYKCLIDGCERLFPRRSAIISHIQTHLEDKPFVCNSAGCHAAFVRQHDLRRHERIHSGTKPFPCPCGKGFARGDALMRHRQRGICVGSVVPRRA